MTRPTPGYRRWWQSEGGHLSTTDEWDAQAEQWIAWAAPGGPDHFFYEFNWPAFEQLLPRGHRRCLDVGSGEGRSLAKLLERDLECVGLEPSATLARRSHVAQLPVIQGRGEALPFSDQSFDSVVAFMVLHDVDDIGTVCREISRVLKRDGTFCFAVIHPMASFPNDTHAQGSAPPTYWTERPYVERGVLAGHTMLFHSVHRPLQAYSDALYAAGMVIERITEPRPEAQYIARHPEASELRRLPLYLHVRARRSGDRPPSDQQ